MAAQGGVSVHLSATPLSFNGSADRIVEAEAHTRSGGATVAPCSGCSGGQKVGNLGGGASVTFNGVQAPASGGYTLKVGYLAEDLRSFTVSVNGGTAQLVSPPRSGKGNNGNPSGWDIVRDVDVPVSLVAGSNTVTIGNAGGFAPDIDRLIVERAYEAESGSNTRTGTPR